MDLKEFDQQTCKQLSLEIQQLLQPLGEKYGVTIRLAGGRYDSVKLTQKIEFKVKDSKVLEDNAKIDFELFAPSYGLKPEHYGKLTKIGNSFYKIAGINTRAHKNNISIERNGKRYKTSVAVVLKGLGEPNSESFVLTSKDIGTLNLNDILEGK